MYLVWEEKGSGKSKVYAMLCFPLLLWQKRDSVAFDSTTKKVNGSQRRAENGTCPSLLEMITLAVGHERPPLQHPCALLPWNRHNIIIFIEQDTFFYLPGKSSDKHTNLLCLLYEHIPWCDTFIQCTSYTAVNGSPVHENYEKEYSYTLDHLETVQVFFWPLSHISVMEKHFAQY